MAEDALLTALEEDAKAQAASIIARAEEEAATLISGARQEADAMLRSMLIDAKRDIARRRALALNLARVKGASRVADGRRALMQDAFEGALRRFFALDRKEYSRVLALWHGELKDAWGKAGLGPDHAVVVNPDDTALMASLMDDRGVPVKADPLVRGGLVFVSDDGSVRFESTFSSRLEMAKKDLVPLLEKVLFSLEQETSVPEG